MQSTTSLGSSKSGVSRDVQDELMSKGRKRLRDIGHKKWSLPYPLVPTDEAIVLCVFVRDHRSCTRLNPSAVKTGIASS